MQASLVSSPVDSAPFDALASTYDEVFTRTAVGRAQRAVVEREMDRYFLSGKRILEINCGTGVDAIHLAQRGVSVVACDESREMIRIARAHAENAGVQGLIEFVTLKTENIFMLGKAFQFDGLLSNFGGLNCTADIGALVPDLATFLKPGAKALICVFSPFCAWETFWFLIHGKPRKAFRRRRASTTATLPGKTSFHVYRQSLHGLKDAFTPYFRLCRSKGVGIAVPPSYLNDLASRFPRAFDWAQEIDRKLSHWPVFHNLADHTLAVFERTEICPQ
jgi:ubiquinone/menaquinone biosynthesis C-methylase UbiE